MKCAKSAQGVNMQNGRPVTQQNQTEQKRSPHKLEIDYMRSISMTGVTAVPVFTDKNITVRLATETLLITGQNLAVKTLDIENGKFSASGQVFSLKYTSQATPTSFVKKLFK